MTAKSCGEKFNAIYMREYGSWPPSGYGYDALLDDLHEKY